MDDEDYRLKIEVGARESRGAWVGCLVVAAMVSALALVLGLAFFSIMAAI